MSEWGRKNLYRADSYKPYRAKEKNEPYGFVKNMQFFKDIVFKDKRLKDKPKLLLAYLMTHCDQDGVCFPSISRIAEDEGVSRQAIQNRLRPLIDFGYIIRDIRFANSGCQTSNTYRLNFKLGQDDCSALTEVSCTTATSEDCPSASSEGGSSATPEDCTKKPFKIPENKYSVSELNDILKEVREITFNDLEAPKRAKITNEINSHSEQFISKRDFLHFQIETLIEIGMGMEISLEKYLNRGISSHC